MFIFKIGQTSRLILILIILLSAILRIPFIDQFPPSLYSDEVAQGYNAYSILKTGQDEHGIYLPVSFRSFGDWKPPLPTYLMLPSIALFGLNSVSVRLPSVILGTATVWLMYLLTSEVLQSFRLGTTKFRQSTSLTAALLLAISPWHILQSRSAMLVGVALFWVCLGMWSFLKALKLPKYWYLSSISFVAAIYSYYGMRLVVPLIVILLSVYFKKNLFKKLSLIIVPCIFSIVLVLPLIISFLFQPNVLLGRVKTVSVFFDKGVALRVLDQIAQDGIDMNPKIAQFLHNKPYYYFLDIIRRFFEHLDGRFLFLIGDQNPPFQIPNMGVMYLIDAFFIISGLIYLAKSDNRIMNFIFGFIIIAILPAALTYVTPAANRSFTLVIPLLIICALGLNYFYTKFSYLILQYIIVIAYVMSFAYFGYQFTYILPVQHADWWHYGYKELFNYLYTQESQYQNIVVSGKLSMPYIFYLFYNQIDPNLAMNLIRRNYHPDEFGFEHVDRIDKYEFPRYFDLNIDKEILQDNSLLAVTSEEAGNNNILIVNKRILLPNQKPAIIVYTKE